MKALLLAALWLPLTAVAADYVEAVQAEQLTGLENSYPTWSADGTRIVFQSTRDGPDADIFVMNADGTHVVQLTRDAWEDSTPVLTPDGRYVIYASEREGNEDIIRIRADGS